ncbi:MAG: transcriptional repressor [Bryobacteraceae bacterium]|nr:transcriptional repressor [Bryobacteraceae bacterium]
MDHVHLVCFECGRIQEYPSSLFECLKDEISRETGFCVQNARLDAGGRCANCCALRQSGAGCKGGAGHCRIDSLRDRVPPY